MTTSKSVKTKSPIFHKIFEEIELISIFVLFLCILIAHETLVAVAKTSLYQILAVWFILLAVALMFFIWVFRYGINKTHQSLHTLLDDRLKHLTGILDVAAKNIEIGNLEALVNSGIIKPESAILELERKVDKAVWVCSPDFRFELGVMGAENYMDVIADNLVRGIPYHYFVPYGQDTIVAVERFSDGLFTAVSIRLNDPDQVLKTLKLVHVVGLNTEQYPATEALGSAVYQFRNSTDVYIGYFPSGKNGWNITLTNQGLDGNNTQWSQHITATLGRLYSLQSAAMQKLQNHPTIKLSYYA